LSVLDNVKIGTHGQMQAGLWGTLARTASQRNEELLTEKQAIEQLHFVGLQSRAFDLAGALAYGEQRRLEIARALASNPQLLLLDEPAAGMNPQESSQLIKLIFKIRDKGITILIIEHDMRVMMNLAEYIYVLDYGGLIGHGTPDEIRANTRVIEAYLGGGGAHAKT
jgi:branched-chain amino acid transport system ATP-binding protein